MNLPDNYKWLAQEKGPLMLKRALELFNVSETLGAKNNPIIINWAKEVGGKVENVYKADEIPWCGLFMAIIAKRSSKQLPTDPLWALNWGAFGKYVSIPMLGDVLVFVRKTTSGTTAGHVGLYIGEDKDYFHVLGGNQADKVCITRIDKKRLYTCRRPNYNIQPKNVRKIVLNATGIITTNEQ